MKKINHIFITISGFVLIFSFLFLGFFLENWYNKLTKPYFIFLDKIGYYKHIYMPDCHHHCLLNNFPNDAPYIFLKVLPVIAIMGLFYYLLSNDKKTLKENIKTLFLNKNKSIKPIDTNNKKQDYLIKGIIIAFFVIIFVFFIFPIFIILFAR